MDGAQNINDEQIIFALQKHRGLAFLAAEALGCEKEYIMKRAKRVKRIRQVMEFQRGRIISIAELKLHQAVQNGQAWAINHMLERGRILSIYRQERS